MISSIFQTILDFFSNLSSNFGISRRTSQAVDYTKGAWSRAARNGFQDVGTSSHHDSFMRNQEGNGEEEGMSNNNHQKFRDDEH